jgi:hypothetical protein
MVVSRKGTEFGLRTAAALFFSYQFSLVSSQWYALPLCDSTPTRWHSPNPHPEEAVMRNPLAAVLIATLVSTFSAHAQSAPNFSGTWKMDPSRSESAAQKDPVGPITLVIAQTPTDLTIETARAEGSSAVTYKLDGSEVKIPGGTAKTHWEGSTLVTEFERHVNGQAVTSKEARSLIANGNEMLVEMTLAVQHGYTSATPTYNRGKDVYVRSR